MAHIELNVLKDFLNGQYVNDIDFDQSFEIIRSAINDNFARLIKTIDVKDVAGTVKYTQALATAFSNLVFKEGSGVSMSIENGNTIVIAVDSSTLVLNASNLADGSILPSKISPDLLATVADNGHRLAPELDHPDKSVTYVKLADSVKLKLVDYATTTSVGNDYSTTLTPSPVSYTEGMALSIKVNANSSGTTTLNVNNLGAKPIKNSDGSNVTDLMGNGVYTLRYDGTNFIIQGASGSTGKDVTARNEIMDIKAKLKEMNLVNFVNKTGLGFYDTFSDDTNVDKVNTSAIHDPLNSQYKFNNDLPVLKSLTTVTGTTISVDRTVYVNDVIQGAKVLSASNATAAATLDYSTNRKLTNSSNTATMSNRNKPTILSNGWFITSYLLSGIVYVRVSKDNGANWSELCFLSNGTVTEFSLVSKGTNLIILAAIGTTEVWSYKFDAATIADVNVTGVATAVKVDWLQTALSKCHIVITPNDRLVAVWLSKHTAYPTYYNIRCSYSDNLGSSWSTQIQLTTSTTAATEYTDIFALAKTDGNIIVSAVQYTHIVQSLVLNAGLNVISNTVTVFTGASNVYPQSSPTMIQIKYGTNAGRIGLVWKHISSSTQYSIATSYSDDGGVTWSAMSLSVGIVSTYIKDNPSLGQDLTGKVYILLSGLSATNTTIYYIKQITSNAFVTFTAPVDLVTGAANCTMPVISDKVENIVSSPMYVYIDANTGSINLAGNFTIDAVTSAVTLDTSVSVTSGQILTLIRNKTLSMLQETFNTYKNIELNVYAKSNKSTVKTTVSNSTSLVTTKADRPISTNDKIFMNGLLQTVVSSSPNTVTVNNTSTVSQLGVRTFKSAPPQVLANGWIIQAVYEPSTTKVHFYRSIDNGANWTLLTSWTIALSYSINFENALSICSKGNIVYVAGYVNTAGQYAMFTKFDATTVGSTISTITSNIIGNGNGLNGLSIGVSTNGVLFLATTNAAYQLYTIKSLDEGASWVKLDGTAVTTSGTQVATDATYAFKNPLLVVMSDTECDVVSYHDNVTDPLEYYHYNGSTYDKTLTTPTIDVNTPISALSYYVLKQKYGGNVGRIWVAVIPTGAVKNIQAYYSDNNGVTWSSVLNVTTGGVYSQTNPSLAEDDLGNVYFVFQGYTVASPTYYNIRQVKYNGTTFGEIVDVTTRTDASNLLPITCVNYHAFTTSPIMIWNDAFNVKCQANYNVPDGFNLTLSAPVTATANDDIFLQDFTSKNNTLDLPLKSIDSEKHVFYKDNISAATTKVEVTTPKVMDCTALAYAIG